MSTSELALEHLILPIVKDLALPKIQALFKKFEIKNTNEESVEAQLRDYLERRYTKFLTIDTLVFPNMQTLLKVLYEPLTVSCREGITRKEVNIKIDCYPKELLPNYTRVIIEDTAGMGKSTITKKLFQSIIEQKAGIPVLIELSQIKKKNSILKEIQNQMSPIGKKISQDLILKLVNEGDFIFLFDGYDEIALDDRDFTIRELHEFIEKAGDNQFLITSRPEESLTSFGDFQKFHVNPLQKEEAYELLKKYDVCGYHKIANSLIDKLKSSDESLEEYLENPFLVSLLYKSYEYKKDIPLKKTQFYEQVYDALFEAHDLSKEGYLKREKYSKLHKDDFEQVLRGIAYFSSMENKIEYDKNTIIQFIKKAKKQTSGLQFKDSDYLKDLLNTVPLFKKEGNDFKWAHKSLQDYFAAKFVWIDAKESRIDILKKIYKDKENQRFFNVLLLYYELDRRGFENTILKFLLIDFKEFIGESYQDFDKSQKSVKKRIEMHFNSYYCFIISKEIEWHRNNSLTIIRNHLRLVSIDSGSFMSHYRNGFFDGKRKKSNINNILKLVHNLDFDITKKVEVQNYGQKTKISLRDIQDKKLYILNDSIGEIYNRGQNFHEINSLMLNSLLYLNTLKYDSALLKLKEIEKNNPEKEKNELLDW